MNNVYVVQAINDAHYTRAFKSRESAIKSMEGEGYKVEITPDSVIFIDDIADKDYDLIGMYVEVEDE